MKHPKRKDLKHELPSWLDLRGQIFFITICCEKRGMNSLCRADITHKLLDTVRFRHEKGLWNSRIWLLMPDHCHALLTIPPDGKPLKSLISEWKAWTCKKFKIQWQSNFFDHRLRSDESLDEKMNYILNNPVRQGYVQNYSEWEYSWKPVQPCPPLTPSGT